LAPAGLPDFGTGTADHSVSNHRCHDRGPPGCPAIRLTPIARFAGFVFRSKTRPSTPTESSSRRLSFGTTCVTDWSFSFRCSPPRIAATQLRFDTARLFTAQKRTSTALSHCPLRRTSGAYKALEQKAAQLKSQLSKLLLSQHQHPRKSVQRTERIAALTEDLAQAQQDQAKTQKEVSRLEVLIEQQMVRLDTRNKRLLDSLKLIARNAFYQALQPFKSAYNNYRDDHELFRNLTQANGVLSESADQVEAYLLPTVNYPPAREKIVNGLLTEINGKDPKIPDGSGRRLQLHLGRKTGLQIAIVP
jgi:hypothetical protein